MADPSAGQARKPGDLDELVTQLEQLTDKMQGISSRAEGVADRLLGQRDKPEDEGDRAKVHGGHETFAHRVGRAIDRLRCDMNETEESLNRLEGAWVS